MRTRFCLLLSLLVLPILAYGQVTVIQVPSGGDLQAAINQAAAIVNGPTPTDVVIEVAPGTYTPSTPAGFVVSGINNPNFTVTLRAAQGPAVTTIDASNVADFAAIRGGEVRNLVIDGFTIRNRIPDETVFGGFGISLGNSSGITVQNCHVDTTDQGIRFTLFDSALGGRFQVVNNTVMAGQGTDPNSPSTVVAQAVNLRTAYPPGVVPTGQLHLIVANNVVRCTASCIRLLNSDSTANLSALLSNVSMEVTGNDASSVFTGGFNILGGHGHYIAENRLHDSLFGGAVQSASSWVIENNLMFNNAFEGLDVVDFGPVPQDFSAEGRLVRHNTIVNNSAVGILYTDADGGVRNFLPSVYNNIVAFNDAGGVAAIENSPFAFAFITVSFDLAANDNFGNTLRNFQLEFAGISNPGVAAPDYSGVINTGLDLSVVPNFTAPENLDFSLKKNSSLVNAGITSRPTPFQDFAGHLRDAQPDIGAFEVVPTPVVNVRSNPLRKGPKDQ